jgi:hypothetical protein
MNTGSIEGLRGWSYVGGLADRGKMAPAAARRKNPGRTPAI